MIEVWINSVRYNVESLIPPGEKFPYWALYHPMDENNEQVVSFFHTMTAATVELKGVPAELPKEKEVQDYGAVPPDQVSSLFSKHPD